MKNITFIHIGKTGGSYLIDLLGIDCSDGVKYRHIKNKPERDPSRKYITWIRNPISRFVSAFNYSYSALKQDVSSISVFNLKTCLIPDVMKKRYVTKTPYLFSKEYDADLLFFETPNRLAESLSSNDNIIKKRAFNLMNNDIQHIHKGLGWYLYNGGFVKKLKNSILFVGKMETMDEDAEKLFKLLNKKYVKKPKVRENIYVEEGAKFMSELAIANIINYYKDSDYAVLKEMKEAGFITEETYNDYHTYVSPSPSSSCPDLTPTSASTLP
jgi:hypothetical protein